VLFRSIYKYFTLKEIALHKALSDHLGIPHDEELYDLSQPSAIIDGPSDVINDLYVQYFEKDSLTEKTEEYFEQIKSQKN
jgi:hypothetical protein